MRSQEFDWRQKGFAQPPCLQIAGPDDLIHRCWGYRTLTLGSSEWGSGFFSIEKPLSVLEAELRFNIVDWNNGVNFVSTFRLKQGYGCWRGSVAHGKRDHALPGVAYVQPPLQIKLQLVRSGEMLKHDVWVGPRDGSA